MRDRRPRPAAPPPPAVRSTRSFNTAEGGRATIPRLYHMVFADFTPNSWLSPCAIYDTILPEAFFLGLQGNIFMEREFVDRAEAIQQRILQLRDSL